MLSFPFVLIDVMRPSDGATVGLSRVHCALQHVLKEHRLSWPLQIRSVDDVLTLGQSLEVAFLGKDAQGRLRLSRKACLPQRSPRK